MTGEFATDTFGVVGFAHSATRDRTGALSHWSDMPTLTEVDEALSHAQRIPADERGAAWHAYVDKLLEVRHTAQIVEAQ